jgi:hypothetical protein
MPLNLMVQKLLAAQLMMNMDLIGRGPLAEDASDSGEAELHQLLACLSKKLYSGPRGKREC